jgi:photosystem II PsbY protein
MDFDFRLLIVLLPILAAAGWAGFNIAAVAIREAQAFLNKQS